MAAQPRSRPDLWQQAIDSLSASTIASLDLAKTWKRDVALAALKAAEEKRQLSLKRRWRIKKLSGPGDIIVRDVVEKIIYWIRRFREIGDQAMQYDPGHAALPWAAFRFLLQAAINETAIHGDMIEGLEMVARLMARFHQLERLYFVTASSLDDPLSDALVKVYAAILKFLAKAITFFDDATVTRLLKAPFRSVLEVGEDLLAKEAEVLKIASLVDAERLGNMETQVLRMADLSVATAKTVEEGQYFDVLRWLSQVPYPHHHSSHQERRLSGTGEWLIQHPDFRSWTSLSSSSLLLLHGIQGCGKTVLCSAFIDQYLDEMKQTASMAPLAYFYCSASESEPQRRMAEGVLRSLVRQITVSKSPQPRIHSAVLALYNKKSEDAKAFGFERAKPTITECVELVLAALEDNPAAIAIDALDEINDPKSLVDSLETIINKSRNVVKVFITSRDDPTIFAMLPSPQMIHITENHQKGDVRSVATYTVESAIADYKLLKGNVTRTLKERIIDDLVSGAGEMILWIKLQVLRLCSFEHEKDLLAALTTLAASNLEGLYQEAYERIQQAGKVAHEIATRSFTWLLFQREPLTVNAFLSAVAAGTQLESLTVDNILTICRGFLVLDGQSQVFRFAHKSVQEFLHLQKEFEPGHAQSMLALSCISICDNFPEDEISEFRPTERPYDYAALYCGHHCSIALSLIESLDLARETEDFLFDEGEPSVCARMWMENVRAAFSSLPREHPQKMAMELISSEQYSPLFPICTFGLSSILKSREWPTDFNWNERNDYGHTYLYAASLFGHGKIVAFLLDQGADSNVECGRLGSALHCAAYRGHTAVVKLLLEHGTNDKLGNKFGSAIHAACRGDHEDVALVILGHDAYIPDQASYDFAIEAVCEAGFSQAVELLQGHPLSRTTRSKKAIQTAKKAICSGKVAAVKFLTRKSAPGDVAIPGTVALSALHGHEAMTVYLLDQGYDMTEPGELGSPLRCASLNGHSSICRVLLDRGMNVNDNDRFGSALHAAAMRGHLHIVKLLLDVGADINIQGGYYGTPLQAAAYQGHKEVVSLLVGAGADVHQSGFSKDSFHAAAEGGNYDIIQLLLALGFTLLEPISELTCSARRSQRRWRRKYHGGSESDQRNPDEEHEIEKGFESTDSSNPTPHAQAYVPFRSSRSPYPLEAAAALGHLGVVRALLAEREILQLDDSAIQTALVVACKNGHQEVIEEILSQIEENIVPWRKALQEAASNSHTPMVHMLLTQSSGAESLLLDCLAATLKSSIAGNEQLFHEMFLIAEKNLSKAETKLILLECLSEAVWVDRGDIVQVILSRNQDVEQKELVDLLTKTCRAGNINAARCLYTTLLPRGLSPKKLSKCIRLAVEYGRIEIVRYLLPSFKKREEQKYLRHMTLVAAGCGYVDILKLLLDEVDAAHTVRHLLLQQALNVSAMNGHEKICEFLLLRGTDPCNPVPTVTWDEISVDRDGDLFSLWYDTESGPGDSEDDAVGNNTKPLTTRRRRTAEAGRNDKDVDPPPLASEAKALNAVESCISGFQRFEFDDRTSHVSRGSEWTQGEKNTQDSTLRLLLQHVPSLTDSVWDEALCAAAMLCPPSLIALMLDKGANTSARHGNRTALDFAVSRECLCFPVLQTFFERRASRNIPESDLRHLLSKALSYFRASKSGHDHEDTLFTTGPGAVIEYLLRRSPEESVECENGSIVLQCAAVAGLTDFCKLLLDRQANFNSVVSYYGTALHAASRFGHFAVVKLFLDNGADVNILQGRHLTALQAAVFGKSLEVVKLLLEAGANTELAENYSYLDGAHLGYCRTPLQLAIQHNQFQIAQALIASGADINTTRGGQQPLLVRACGSGDLSLICALLEAGADVNTQGHTHSYYRPINQEDGSGVHAAIQAGHMDVIKLLLLKGFRLSADFGNFEAPLAFAASRRAVDMIDVLLTWEPAVSNETMRQALTESVKSSNLFALEKLLFHKPAALDTESGASMLNISCSKGDVNAIELLLETLSSRGQVESACTAVLNSPPDSRAAVFEMILEYVPCSVNLFVVACICGYEGVVKTGLAQGISPRTIDSKGRPALHSAAIHGSVAVVELLLMSGADPNAEDPVFGMPLRAALEGCAVRNLTIYELPDDIERYARLLTWEEATDPEVPYHFRDRLHHLNGLSVHRPQQYEKTVRLLLEKGAQSDMPAGIFGSTFMLTMFTGIRNIPDILLQHGASFDTVGGPFHPPLLASVEGNHINLA